PLDKIKAITRKLQQSKGLGGLVFVSWGDSGTLHSWSPSSHRSRISDLDAKDVDARGMSLTPEVRAFCAQEDITAELRIAIDLAKQCFDLDGEPSVRLEQDPEVESSYLVVDVVAKGSIDGVVAAYNSYASEWATAVAWPKVEKIRLAYDII